MTQITQMAQMAPMWRLTPTLVAVLLACLPLVTHAEQSSRKRQAFEAELLMASVDDDRLKQWAANQAGAALDTVTEFRPGQPVIAQARIRGCDPADVGRCRVTVQYAAYGPDGQMYHQAAAEPVEAGKPAPGMSWTFSNTDAAGLYRVVAIVRDLNAKRMVRTERLFGLRVEEIATENTNGTKFHGWY